MAVPPMLIAGAAQGLGQLITGISQRRQARKLKPSTYIPPSLQEAVGSARSRAQATRYAGQGEDERSVRQATQTAMGNVQKSTSSSATALNAAASLAGREQAGMRNISQRAMQNRERQQQIFESALKQRANVEAQNRRQYEAAKSALRGASMQNTSKGLGNFGMAAGLAGDKFLSSRDGGGVTADTSSMMPQTSGLNDSFYNMFNQKNNRVNSFMQGLGNF
jgi:hypothetical protein